MKALTTSLLIWAVVAGITAAWGATPYIGYVYPAGGQQGAVVHASIGGQHLHDVQGIILSGSGARAAWVGYEGVDGPLNAAQREVLKQRLQDLIAQRTHANTPAVGTTPVKPTTVTLPDLPALRNLDQMTVKQLRQVMDKYIIQHKRTKPPIAENVTLDIMLAPDAVPGDRELRLITPGGLSNPVMFQVGALPEVCEKDRNDDQAAAPPPANVPVVLNGQVMPGEVDRFALQLHGGQQLRIAAQARHLIPYMADAVPGWMQAVLTLYDAHGKELAYADDTCFDPDPSLTYQVPQDGDYVLAIRDALYRGREDFVYRITLCEATPGQPTYPFARLGRVMPGGVPDDVDPQRPAIDSRVPQSDEVEPDDTAQQAERITLPQLISGCIAQPGDIDTYHFSGKAGDTVVAEVYARRLGSPMDSLLRLIDDTGHVLAWNDDYEFGEMGLVTHQADSYLSAKLPADGDYYIQVSDAQHHGGDAYRYDLRVAPPQADFALRMTPSGVSLAAGGKTTITVYAFRKDGWDGDIDVALQDAPPGFVLSDTRIPAGQTQATMTLTAPRKKFDQPIALRLAGHAVIGGTTVTRPVLPADRKMQAFAYYHLVPAQQLLVMVRHR